MTSLLLGILFFSGFAYSDDQSDIQLVSGEFHSCSLQRGKVECWGENKFGQTTVPPLKNPRQVTAGARHSCALDDEGVKCWGNNDYGQINVPPLNNPRLIDAGDFHTCAVTDEGTICWWYNQDGQSDIPRGRSSEFLAAGTGRTCLVEAGRLTCYGLDFRTEPRFLDSIGQIRMISVGRRVCALDQEGVKCSKPTSRHDGMEEAPALNAPYFLTAGPNATCAADANGLKCWADISNSIFHSRSHMSMPVPRFKNVRALGIGQYHACGADEDGIRCWGHGYQEIPNIKNASVVQTTWRRSCALTDEKIQCWGEDPDFFLRSRPPLGKVSNFAMNHNILCALDEKGLKCWTGHQAEQPIELPAGLKGIREIAVGRNDQICVIHDAGVTCWGERAGKNGTMEQFEFTHNLPGARSLSVGQLGCVIAEARAHCWETDGSLLPSVPARGVYTQYMRTVILDDEGVKYLESGFVGRERIYKWKPVPLPFSTKFGRTVTYFTGQICVLGDKEITCHQTWNPSFPFSMPKFNKPTSIVADEATACAIDAEGVKCWGKGYEYIWDVPKK